MHILGVDPGSSITAFGIVDSQTKQASFDFLKLPKKLSQEDKIYKVYLYTKNIIENNGVDGVVLEGTFYSVNIKSAMILSQMRAAVIVAAKEFGIDIFQYQPREIKQAVCGYGGAAKEQIRFIVEKTLSVSLENQPLDVSDALAIALTHIYTIKNV